MSTIARVLCPVDFSESSQLALDYAFFVARRRRAALTVLHVIANPHPDGYPYMMEPVVPDDEMRGRAGEELARFVERSPPGGVDVARVVAEGDVVDTVVERADAADIVVMGTHGRRGLARMLIGSVAERVLRRAPCPVLSVSPQAPQPTDGLFDNVLCPIDFSACSSAAYRLALELGAPEGKVTLLHVVEFFVDVSLGASVAFDIEEVRDRHRSEALAKLEAMVPAEAKSRTELAAPVMSTKSAYREILDASEKNASDAIVMGVMGRSAADVLFFGSTTNHVVRSAGCPVVTVRPER